MKALLSRFNIYNSALSRKDRQQRYRERRRGELKQREAEGRRSK